MSFLYFFLIIITILTIYIVIPSIYKIIIRKQFLLNIIQDKNIYLTFDDGPNPESTPSILKILDNYKVKATFFIVGRRIKDYPWIVRDILTAGHEIGYHSYFHHHPWKSDPFTALIDILKFHKIIIRHDLVIKYTKLYRPTYGKFNLINLLYVLLTKKRTIFWTIDPKDYKSNSPESIAKYISENLKAGSIILMHDGRISSEHTSPDVTVKALERLLESIIKQGYKFSPISSAIKE